MSHSGSSPKASSSGSHCGFTGPLQTLAEMCLHRATEMDPPHRLSPHILFAGFLSLPDDQLGLRGMGWADSILAHTLCQAWNSQPDPPDHSTGLCPSTLFDPS